jgi:hypothetical protein
MSFGKIENKVSDADIQRRIAAQIGSSDSDDSDIDSDEEEEYNVDRPANKKRRLSNDKHNSPVNNTVDDSFIIDGESDIEDDDAVVRLDHSDEEDEILKKYKNFTSVEQHRGGGSSSRSEVTNLVDDDSDDSHEEEVLVTEVSIDANTLLEQRRREADEDEDDDDDVFKTVEKRQERVKQATFTFIIQINSKESIRIPYNKSEKLDKLEGKFFEKLENDHPDECEKFHNTYPMFDGQQIPRDLVCATWLEEEDFDEDENETQIEFGRV